MNDRKQDHEFTYAMPLRTKRIFVSVVVGMRFGPFEVKGCPGTTAIGQSLIAHTFKNIKARAGDLLKALSPNEIPGLPWIHKPLLSDVAPLKSEIGQCPIRIMFMNGMEMVTCSSIEMIANSATMGRAFKRIRRVAGIPGMDLMEHIKALVRWLYLVRQRPGIVNLAKRRAALYEVVF